MARPKDKNSRRSRAERRRLQKEADAAARGLAANDLGQPNMRVQSLRRLFAWLRPDESDTSRKDFGGTIDQDICDGVGQLHALGLLDGHGHDPLEMRDRAREWGHHYAQLLRCCATRTSSYERMDKGVKEVRYTAADRRFDAMDESLGAMEKAALLSLIVDNLIGDFAGQQVVPWAQALVDEAMLKRGKVPHAMRFPDEHDRSLHRAAIRGMCQLVDATLPMRRNHLAA